MTGHEKTFTQPERKEAPMRRLFESRPRGLCLLAGLLAALLLVPAAAASAAINTHIVIGGSGSGEVVGAEGAEGGVPRIECHYTPPGPTTGVCDTTAQKIEGLTAIRVEHLAAPGSKFVGWKVEKGALLTFPWVT